MKYNNMEYRLTEEDILDLGFTKLIVEGISNVYLRFEDSTNTIRIEYPINIISHTDPNNSTENEGIMIFYSKHEPYNDGEKDCTLYTTYPVFIGCIDNKDELQLILSKIRRLSLPFEKIKDLTQQQTVTQL